jgi:hypothetical protein
MYRLPMRYLLFISLVLFFYGCSNAYRGMTAVPGNAACLERFKPHFIKTLYRTRVDLTGNHLSGILLIKLMPDSSTRMVLSNEMGFSYFDFAFAADGSFRVFYILPKMNKKAVITTLRKDFELVLMQHLDSQQPQIRRREGLTYYRFPQASGSYYYITTNNCGQLVRMERAGRHKPVVAAVMSGSGQGVPDSIGITHNNFNFTIGLKKISP